MGTYDLRRCDLTSVYVYNFVIVKILSGYFGSFVIVDQWVLYSYCILSVVCNWCG